MSRVSIRPGVRVLSVLRHLNYKPLFALAEFVDNSLQSFLDNREALQEVDGTAQCRVQIRLEGDPPRLTIRDNAVSFRGQNSTLRASLRFDAPFTRLLERNNYRQSLISYAANRRDLIQFEDQTSQSLRNTLRQMELSRKNIEIQRNALRLAVVRVDLVLASLREPPPAVTPGQPAPALVAS